MKNKIVLMPDNLANMIAAGEVIDKCVNIVKELVENSIDAGSKKIIVNLLSGGLKKIEVIDNGSGMTREDALMSLKRHATSKLLNEHDLFNIVTLGFRGEAIPSIASVSDMKIYTSSNDETTYLHVRGGELVEENIADLKNGTKIVVTDLFFNTPVRFKYLKNIHNELASIVLYVNKLALAHPDIKFILTNDEKELLNTRGNNDIKEVIAKVYGLDVAKKVIYFKDNNLDYEIEGYYGYPELQKRTNSSITTIINKRVIKNYEINKTISDFYHNYMPPEKYPYVVLYINVDPSLIDVNIHPTKSDIKFSKMATLTMLIEDSLKEAFKKESLIPTITNDKFNLDFYEGTKLDFIENTSFDLTETYLDLKQYEEVEIDTKEKFRVIGIFRKTYIILENIDGLYLVDQHAAAEKINFEKVLKYLLEDNKTSIDLLVPIHLELEKNDLLLFDKDKCKDLGFDIEVFGENDLVIRSVPSYLKDDNLQEDLKDIVLDILHNQKFDKKSFYYDIAATTACKMSLKAHDYLNIESSYDLVDRLFKCDNPYNCPHGRPTVIKFTVYEIERMFKRIMN
jgi:DNA mismatch repair protein mutL